jgi:hypothetical protein
MTQTPPIAQTAESSHLNFSVACEIPANFTTSASGNRYQHAPSAA